MQRFAPYRVSAAVHKRNDERKQQETEGKDTDKETDKNESASPNPKSGQHQNMGGATTTASRTRRSTIATPAATGHQPSPKPST